jgi:hypothetical protein
MGSPTCSQEGAQGNGWDGAEVRDGFNDVFGILRVLCFAAERGEGPVRISIKDREATEISMDRAKQNKQNILAVLQVVDGVECNVRFETNRGRESTRQGCRSPTYSQP